MKKKIILLFLIIGMVCNALFSQKYPPGDFGGGEYHFEQGICVTPEQRILMDAQAQENIDQLIAAGILSAEKSLEQVTYRWPLEQAEGFNYNSYYGISNYLDQDPTGGIQDYNCTSRSYDGHRGTDIFLWPFQWHMVENNHVEVVAAAPGTIIWKNDGNDSYNCVWGPGLTWNAVFVRHDDNSVSRYGHMKEGSLTDKAVGAAVEEGEYLGIVASSGFSTGPHLHFEIYNENGSLVDPYSGTCNSLNQDSYWQIQKPYREPMINVVLTHWGDPVFTNCDNAANPVDNRVQDCFQPGNTVYFATYYHDQMQGMVSSYKVYQPDNTIQWEWTHTSPSTYNASYWYWSRTLPDDAPEGNWRIETTFEGQTVGHDFYVGSAGILADNDIFSFCTGETLTLTASEGVAYLWSDGSTDQSIEVNAGGNYSVSITTSEGCELEASQIITENPLPVIAGIDGVTSSSPLVAEFYSVEDHAGSEYFWTVSGGTIISGEGTASIEVGWHEVPSGEVCVIETSTEGCQSESVCLSVDIQVSDLEDIAALNAISVFPNPVQDQFLLELDLETSVPQLNLKIHNTAGQMLYQSQVSNIAAGKWQKLIDVTTLPTGIYWLEIQFDQQSIALKLMKF